jgi:hypothetical protein
MAADPTETVIAYLDAIDRHDIEVALGHLAEAFVLEFVGGPSIGKAELRPALGWDAATESRTLRDVIEAWDSTVVVEGRQSNEFYRLLGLGPVPFRARFEVGDDGLIHHQHYEAGGPGPAYTGRLAAAVAWAKEHDPEELAAIHRDGRILYSERMGRRWVSLLRRWNESRQDA